MIMCRCQRFFEQENEMESFGFSPFEGFSGSRRCCGNGNRERDRENAAVINIRNDVEIRQEASADGGEGGNYNNANGGSASAAAAGDVAVAAALQAAKNESENEPEYDPFREAANKAERGSQPSSDDGNSAEAEGGDAKSGNGGDGGTAVNVSDVDIKNIVIIPGRHNSPYSAYRLNVNDSSFDIMTDESGNTFVNGKKMDEKSFEDGSKVFIFKSAKS